MRHLIAAMVCLLAAACSGLPPPPPSACSTPRECELLRYARAGG